MLKRFAWLMLLLACAAPAAEATNVGGSITTNTTWTLAASPFIVTSTVTLSNNATLTIEAGVQVKFNANTGLTIGSGTAGILKAQGTASQPITFTSNNATPAPGQWNGIVFLLTTSASVMDRCVVEYGGAGSNDVDIRVTSSTPAIRNSTIRQSDGYGVYVTGANVRPVLTGNTFTANGRYPLRVQIDSLPATFSGNTFTANGTQAIEVAGGTAAGTQTLTNAGVPYIVTSAASLNNAGKLTVALGTEVRYQALTSMTVYGSGTLIVQAGAILRFNPNTGLILGSGTPGILQAQGTTAQPVTFTTNSATPAPGQWNGITFNVTTPASIMDYCIVQYGGAGSNDADILAGSGTAPAIRHSTIRFSDGAGIRLSSAQPVIEQNTITGNVQGIVMPFSNGLETIRHNAISGNSAAGLVNNGTVGVVARLNWWGHASGPSGIGPGSGSSITGNVLFEPWLGQTPSDPFAWTSVLNSPDPFTQSGGVTTFFGSLPQSANWKVTVKNASATVVKTLTGTGVSFAQDWNGTDTGGAMLPNGAYTFQLDATNTSGGQIAASAIGAVTLNNALPVANITSPTPDQMFAPGSITIIGTIGGLALSSYKVEYGVGVAPTSWFLIKSQANPTPITNGTLAIWNTSALTAPLYTLRVTATSTTSQTATEQVTVRLLSWSAPTDSVDPFSPNGDGKQDTTTLGATATFPVSWTLSLKNSSSAVVRTFSGSGQAVSQAWDGKDAGGAAVPDGLYTYQFQGTHAETGVIATSAAGQVTLDLTAPTAIIASPTQNQTFLTDAPVTATGTAADTNFLSYVLAYGVGSNPASVTTLVTSSAPVSSGALGTLNPQGFAPGTYTFRLTVTDRAGNVSITNRQMVFDHIQISAVSATPAIVDPYNGEQAGIKYTLGRSANVTVKIYADLSKQLMRTLTAAGQPAGAQTLLWDGKNTAGAITPLEAYYVTIDAVDPANASRKGSYNNATTPLPGLVPNVTSTPTLNATGLDPYRNDQTQITYTFDRIGRLRVLVQTVSGTIQTIRTLLNQAIRTAGAHTEVWDGRRDDGSVYQGTFNVFLDVPVALPLNAIVLSHPLPTISNFRAEAYVIQPVFGEVSTMTYTLSQNANVSVVLTDPNGNAVRTLLATVPQTAGAQTLEWNGRTDAGSIVSVEGDYRVTLTATDAVSGQSTTRLGAVVVYK